MVWCLIWKAAGPREAVRDEHERVKDPRFTGFHVGHVPVIDEDDEEVDFEEVIHRAIGAGFGAVMVNGSRLPFDRNIARTQKVVWYPE